MMVIVKYFLLRTKQSLQPHLPGRRLPRVFKYGHRTNATLCYLKTTAGHLRRQDAICRPFGSMLTTCSLEMIKLSLTSVARGGEGGVIFIDASWGARCCTQMFLVPTTVSQPWLHPGGLKNPSAKAHRTISIRIWGSGTPGIRRFLKLRTTTLTLLQMRYGGLGRAPLL